MRSNKMTVGDDMLTQERLKHLLWYAPSSGDFFWKNPPANGPANVGNRAGSENGSGYLRIRVDGKLYQSHRLAWLFCHGYFPENDLDHINRDRADNRLANLREVSRSCNLRNTGNSVSNTSGIKGVFWNKTEAKWYVSIYVGGLRRHLGCFEDITEAAAHRLCAEQCLDWQDCNSSSPAFQHMKKYLEGGGYE